MLSDIKCQLHFIHLDNNFLRFISRVLFEGAFQKETTSSVFCSSATALKFVHGNVLGSGFFSCRRVSRRIYLAPTKTLTMSFINCKLWNQMKRLTTGTQRSDLTIVFYNGNLQLDVILLRLFGHLPRSVARRGADWGDNRCFHPLPGSLLTVYVNICLDGPTFPTFHFPATVFFYEKCIMHNWLPEYYIVALAIWETSSPAALWKSSLQTGMICTAVVNPHQRTWWLNEMLEPEQVCSGAASLLEESEARSEALQRNHCTCWENPGCGRINACACRRHTFLEKSTRFIGGCNRLNTAASSQLRFLHYQGKT